MQTAFSLSLSRQQKRWLDARKQAGNYSTRSGVVQDLIRQAMAAEAAEEPETPVKRKRGG